MRHRESCLHRPCLLGSALALTALYPNAASAVSPDIVISQVYGGGGNAGATYTHDFIELFNRGPSSVSVSGWTVQYTSAAGSTWQTTLLTGSIPPGGYFLVQEAMGTGGSVALPTPNATGTTAMSGTTGKVALVSGTTALASGCPGPAQGVVDLVGYGGASCSESSPTTALSNTTAALRANGGCTDSDNNAGDFAVLAPNPRNSSAAQGNCGETAPAVASTSPVNGATAVPTTVSAIVVNFSEPVNVATGAITLECPVGVLIAANASASNTSSVSFSPGVLPQSTTCRVSVVAASVSDVDANDPPDTMTANFVATFSTASGAACGAADTQIGLIQGSGTSAALTGTRTVQGVVVGDFEFPAGGGSNTDYLRGFYLQNVGGSEDGDPATSDAIFVFNGNNDSVSLGQVVQVTGTVGEFGFSSSGGTQTQLTSVSIELCGTSASATPINVTLPLASSTALERYEGMLVRFTQTLSVSEHFQLGRFGQVLISAGGRLPQPTEVAQPGAPALAQQAQNDLNQILLDDDVQVQNPDPIRFARGTAQLSASNTLRGGDTVTDLTGVLTQTDATTASNVPSTSDPVLYRVRPFNALNAPAPNFAAANPRPGAVATVTGTLKVAGANLLNYFNTLGTAGQANCNAGVGGAALDCRGAEDANEFVRQWQKTVAALLSMDADIYVLNELEHDGYGAGSALQDLVTRLNNASAAGTFAFVDVDARTGQTNALGSDAIRVAMIYKPAKVSLLGTSVANTGAYGIYQTGAGPLQRNRPALAQGFLTSTGARLVVVANHLKSKGSSCSDNISPVPSDVDMGDGQGECNQTRNAAAAQLVSWLAGDPTASGTGQVLLMGDYNAYAMEDPIATLETGGYHDLAPIVIGGSSYSYVFDGQWGSLDHALASASLQSRVTGLVEWHINADEPGVLDYNTNFKSAAQQTNLYAADRFRASDHDALIVGLTFPPPAGPSVPALPWRQHELALLLGLLLLGAGFATRAAQQRARAA